MVRTYPYDPAGRTKTVVGSNGTTFLTYDFESRLTQVSGAPGTHNYTYNGLDTRVSKNALGQTTSFLRDGAYVTDPVIADSLATYTPGVSERRGGTTRYNHSGLKNTGAQSTNAIVATRVYDAYGMVRSTTGTWSGPFGYAGDYGYQEDETGLRLLGHRYYDASTGRFLTRDPIKDGRNWYAYCDGDPINGVDPTGLVRIYLVIIPVTAGVGTGHALLVIVDNVPSSPTYGEVSIVEGARAGLRLEGGRHAPSKQDWSLIGDPLGGSQRDSIFRIMLIDDQSSYSDWTREADKVIKKMKGKKGLGGYDPASKNSNTFLSEVLRKLGLLDIANAELKQPRNRWGGSRPLPGWGQPWK